ncbi:MAG: hypothetical protein J6M53_08460 [Bacteroidaceae bacterium]|nr:hypothetical protein [Bacteroidaceae bacterium]
MNDNQTTLSTPLSTGRGAGGEAVLSWEDVSKTFALCPSADCAVREACLRWVAAQLLPEDKPQWMFVAPRLWRTATADGCEAFRTAEPVRMARGFTRALGDIASKHRPAVYAAICRALGTGRNHYYEMRRGQRALSPKEQDVIAAILASHGAPQPVEFDAYEQMLFWED